MTEQLIDLDKKQLHLLKDIIKRHIPDKVVWAYGSRVRWKANEMSDLDLAVFNCTPEAISNLREALEESELLTSVSVMDWESIPDDFKKKIKEKYVVLQEATKPEGWREVRLGDVAEVKTGEYLEKGKRLSKGKYEFLGANGRLAYANSYLLDGEYILTGRVGTIGRVSYKKGAFYPSDNVLYIKSYKTTNNKFLFYLLSVQCLDNLNVGSTQPLITQSNLRDLSLKIPPLPEQKSIAEVLSSLDDKIDLLHRQNKTLEVLAQTLFRKWFIEDADENWEEKPLSYFGEVICGKTPSKKKQEYFGEGIPFIKIPDMHENVFVFESSDSLSKAGRDSQKNKTLPPKSICVSCIATVGLVSMNAFESQTNQQINSIIPYKDEYRYYVYLFMKSQKVLLEAMASGGTATMNLNTSDFSKMQLPVQDNSIISNFNTGVEPLFDKIFANQSQARILGTLRNTLLPKLMNGKARIKHLECEGESSFENL